MYRPQFMKWSILGLALGSLVLGYDSARADDTPPEPIVPGPWAVDLKLGLLVSQSSFSNNWAKGDKGSFSWVANTDLNADRQVSYKFNWSNFVRLALVHMIYDKYDANTNVAGDRPFDETVPLVDGAIRTSPQWRQTLALGLTYQLF